MVESFDLAFFPASLACEGENWIFAIKSASGGFLFGIICRGMVNVAVTLKFDGTQLVGDTSILLIYSGI